MSPSTLRVSLLQQPLAWEKPERNREHLARMLEPLIGQTDVALLPETFPTGFTSEGAPFAETMDGPTCDWLRGQASRLGAVVAGSAFIRAGDAVHNRLLWVAPDGTITSYDKRHLFRMGGEHLRYAAGSEAIIVEWRGFRICPLVCYDLRFPVWSRKRPGLDYDLLVYVANWPAARRYAWQQLLRARAIENQAFVAAVNRVGDDGRGIAHAGDSAVYDALGQPLVEMDSRAGVATVTIDLHDLREFRDRFPVHLDADRFTLAPP